MSFDITSNDLAGDLAVIGGVADKYNIDTTYVFDADTADKAQYRDEVALVVGDSFSGFLSTIAKGYYKEVHWMNTMQMS